MTWDEFNQQEQRRRDAAQQSMYQVNLRADNTAYDRDQDALRQQVAAKARDDALNHQNAVMEQQKQLHDDSQKADADRVKLQLEDRKIARQQQEQEFKLRQDAMAADKLARAQAKAKSEMDEALQKMGEKAMTPHLREAELISKSTLQDTDALNAAHAAAIERAQAARDDAQRQVYTQSGQPLPPWLQPKGVVAPTIDVQEPDTTVPGTDLPLAGRKQTLTDYPVEGTLREGEKAPLSAGEIMSRARKERDDFGARNDKPRQEAEAARLAETVRRNKANEDLAKNRITLSEQARDATNPHRKMTEMLVSEMKAMGIPESDEHEYVMYEAAKAKGVPLPDGTNKFQEYDRTHIYEPEAATHAHTDLMSGKTLVPTWMERWQLKNPHMKNVEHARALYDLLAPRAATSSTATQSTPIPQPPAQQPATTAPTEALPPLPPIAERPWWHKAMDYVTGPTHEDMQMVRDIARRRIQAGKSPVPYDESKSMADNKANGYMTKEEMAAWKPPVEPTHQELPEMYVTMPAADLQTIIKDQPGTEAAQFAAHALALRKQQGAPTTTPSATPAPSSNTPPGPAPQSPTPGWHYVWLNGRWKAVQD